MFKKLKDKLAEEVKSSPQRIQQFAQAAQAAVTSASSSISDITNNDLFSIGDSDSSQQRSVRPQAASQQSTFQEVSLFQPSSTQSTPDDFGPSHENMDNQRQRRLSNSSFASDVSFRLPSYESPSMYHLQSDMEISASEAEERGFSSGQVSLERVTKDQLYAAYKRTQERYTKYRTQYANLAHHYKLLERENAKARSVLVETQDKALRRISELREQCTLEQSAKAHLEKALRVDIEERNMKIEALNTQISLLQNNADICKIDNNDAINANSNEKEQEAQLINLAPDNEVKQNEQVPSSELTVLNNKIEKMEQLLNKYKESLKTTKEKNAQITAELQKITNELEIKNKETDVFKNTSAQLVQAKQRIQELNIINEELQNKINTYDFSKTKEMSTIELDLQRAREEIEELNNKIDIFTKREEEYAISLAENKLSIHKELESKESEIKSLKASLSAANKELQSINIIVSDYKNSLALAEEEKTKLNNEIKELVTVKSKIKELDAEIQLLTQKLQSLEQSKSKCEEEYRCLQLQMKQETAEKLAIIDRNGYLENRNAQLTEENTKKSSQITKLENEFQELKTERENNHTDVSEKNQMQEERDIWKAKYSNLESEIQEERDELVKLQSEIEKLLRNHELIQNKNSELNIAVSNLSSEKLTLHQKLTTLKPVLVKLANEVKDLQKVILQISEQSKSFKNEISNKTLTELKEKMSVIMKYSKLYENEQLKYENLTQEYNLLQNQLKELLKNQEVSTKNLIQLKTDNEILTAQIQEYKELQINLGDSQNELKKTVSKQEATTKELLELKESNASLSSRIHGYETIEKEYELSQKKLLELKKQQDVFENDYNVLQKENDALTNRLQEFELLQNAYKKLQTELIDVNKNYDATVQELHVIQKECTRLNSNIQEYDQLQRDCEYKEQTLKQINNENEKFKKEFEYIQEQNESLQLQLKEYQSELENIKDSQELGARKLKEYEQLTQKLRQECTENEIKVGKLEDKLESYEQENMSLKSQSENIKINAISLESELEDVRRAHSVMEVEKDRLSLIIEQLEQNQQTAEMKDKEIQAEENVLKNFDENERNTKSLLLDIESLSSKNADYEKEVASLKEINMKLSNKAEESNIEREELRTLSKECEVLREENKRLQSDITGLQIYLAKISKENGDLNDRLRELISSSENVSDKKELTVSNSTDLQKDISLGKQSIDDLLRENTLLIEENLELKDQIQSQNYVKHESAMPSHNNTEISTLKEKYNELLNAKKNLDDRVRDLEQINRSVNGNVQQMQDGNQKLRLANEKLERRLDEALVSLRHLHSLQENTELEYLRNILYEYLTGSGTHSITLAKVLAAVVKFDDKQTQAVLQKEKERQSVLHQLGLM